MMNFHSESRLGFLFEFFSVDFLGPSVPLQEGQKIHCKIHDKTFAKSTHVVKKGIGKSTLQEEGPEP